MTSFKSDQGDSQPELVGRNNQQQSQGISGRNRLRSQSEEFSSSYIRRPFLPFDTRLKIYSYLDLMTLINVVSKLSKFERLNLVKNIKALDQTRALLINIVADLEIDFNQLKYFIQLSSKLDLRIQTFDSQDKFLLAAILYFCTIFEKKIELNIWVDFDIQPAPLIKCFQLPENCQLIEFVYFRFDRKNSSHKLR